MSEEIELILYKLEQNYKCDKEQYFILYKPDIKQLLDYINNLKYLYDKSLEDSVKESKRRMELDEENKKLKRLANKDYTELNIAEMKAAVYKSRCMEAIKQSEEKVKMYKNYLNDLKKGNYPSGTIYQERQELLYRIKEQEELLDILQKGDK